MIKPRSESLFHFTKEFEHLKSILENGFWPRYCMENFFWASDHEQNKFAFPMVCFCDIPLTRSQNHMLSYGEYGLGVTRKWVEKNGLNPVIYTAKGSNLEHVIVNMITDRSIAEHVSGLLAFMKPTTNEKGQEHIDYTQECEWRYVAKREEFKAYLTLRQFLDEKELIVQNTLTYEHAKLSIENEDISFMIVPNDKCRVGLTEVINQKYKDQPEVIANMISKIIQTDTFLRDL